MYIVVAYLHVPVRRILIHGKMRLLTLKYMDCDRQT